MDEKVIIVKKKPKKVKSKKKKPKPKAKPTMEQRVSQYVKVIINDRVKPKTRQRALAVRGYNMPRVRSQNVTMVHKALEAQSAMNSFQGIYNTRLMALERNLDGVNGNISTLQNTLRNNRQLPLNEQRPELNEEAVRLGQEVINARKIADQEERERQFIRLGNRNYLNSMRASQGGNFDEDINSIFTKSDPEEEEEEEETEIATYGN